jgi:hypothetical protein
VQAIQTPLPQLFPQGPQLLRSREVSRHVPLQSASGAAHLHSPLLQIWFERLPRLHWPQLSGSVLRSTHLEMHNVDPDRHMGIFAMHCQSVRISSPEHAQAPHALVDVMRSRQAPPQLVSGVPQLPAKHMPLRHTSVAKQGHPLAPHADGEMRGVSQPSVGLLLQSPQPSRHAARVHSWLEHAVESSGNFARGLPQPRHRPSSGVDSCAK